MTRQDVAKLLLVIAARYPTSKLWAQSEELTVKAWHMTLADVNYPDAERALAEWFKSEKWAPDPSELRGRVASAVLGLPEPEEAWMEARAAMHAYYPGFPMALEILPAVRRAINAAGGLHYLVTSTSAAKDREVFLRAYAVERKREVETAILNRPAIEEGKLRTIGGG